MKKHKHRKKHDTLNGKPLVKKDLGYYQENFHETCPFCGEDLVVIKHRPKTNSKKEVVTATCQNDKFKGMDVKCERWCIEILFMNSAWC